MFSVHSMTITMLDSAAGMRAMLDSSPEQWPDATSRMWQPMAGMYFFIPGGPDMAAVHGQNFGFGPGAPRQEMVDALHRLEQADAWSRIERALTQGTQDLAAACLGKKFPDLTVLLILGDPTNHFMDEIRGPSAFGGPVATVITVWPTDEVLDRLGRPANCTTCATARRDRGTRRPPRLGSTSSPRAGRPVCCQSHGRRGFTHFVTDQTRRSDDVLCKVVEGLDVTGMQDSAAWVLGDASALSRVRRWDTHRRRVKPGPHCPGLHGGDRSHGCGCHHAGLRDLRSPCHIGPDATQC